MYGKVAYCHMELRMIREIELNYFFKCIEMNAIYFDVLKLSF